MIGLVAGTTLKFINNTRCKVFAHRDFVLERIGKIGFASNTQICGQNPTLSRGSFDADFFLPTFPLIKLLIYESISCLKTLILLAVSQSQNLHSYYVWLQISPILYLTVYFTNRWCSNNSPLEPSFAKAFLSYQEKNLLNNCPQ